jgi:hypothetical protein
MAKFRACRRNRVLIATLPVSLLISLRAGLLGELLVLEAECSLTQQIAQALQFVLWP